MRLPSATDPNAWSHGLLAAVSLLILWACWPALGSAPVTSDDLPAHVAVVDLVRQGRLSGWDPLWFGGWPLFQFYPLGFHALAATLSWPLGWVAEDPSRFATHTLFAMSLAALPWSAHALARQLTGPVSPGRGVAMAALLAAFSAWLLFTPESRLTVTLWRQWQLGQVAEPAGWNLMLVFLAALAAIVRAPRHPLQPWLLGGALALAGLVLVHQLTAALAAGLALALAATRPRAWPALAGCAALAAALSAFYWLPFVAHAGDYVQARSLAGDVVLPLEFLRALLLADSAPLTVRLVNGLAVAGLVGGLLAAAVRRPRRLAIWPAVWLLAAVMAGRPESLDWLPSGVHLYRWNHALMWLAVPIAVAALGATGWRWATGPSVLLVLVLLPGLWGPRATLGEPPPGRQAEVVAHFQANAPQARVLVERAVTGLNDAGLPRGQTLVADLHRAGIESANGLFIQAAPHYGALATAASALGLPMFAESAGLDPGGMDPQGVSLALRRHRITHLVLAQARPLPNAPAGWSETVRLGPVAILEPPEPTPTARLARPVHAPLVAVLDPGASGGFAALDAWHAQQGFASLLVAMAVDDPLLAAVAGAICIDDGSGACPDTLPGGGPLIRLPGEALARPLLGPGDPTLRQQRLASLMADEDTGWLKVEPSVPGPVRPLTMAGNGPQITLADVVPGSRWRLPYNYFPGWSVVGGRAYRSSAGFILVLADEPAVVLDYSRFGGTWQRAGLVLSLVGFAVAAVLTLAVARRRRDAPERS